MSRVRWAVRNKHGFCSCPDLAQARDWANKKGGKIVRVTQYSAAETKARRALIAAARALLLELLEEREAGK